jgi:peptidoglycan hydrolase-like protein with peptidoglycan-binding domain
VALRAIGPTSEVALGRPVPQTAPTPASPSPSSEPVAVPAVVLKQIQATLSRKGFNPGAVDGRIGDQTQSALAEYQARAGLPRTGLLDQRTLDRLVNEPEFTNFATSVPLNAPR